MIKIALATVHLLGLRKIRIDKKSLPHTAHFMTSGKCSFDCDFCSQAKNSNADNRYLSRVIWPEYDENIIKDVLKRELNKKFKRICLQVVQNSNYLRETLSFIRFIRECSNLPLSISVRTESLEEIKKLFAYGASQVGLALDAVEKKDYQKIKKGYYYRFLNFLIQAARQFPGKITTHIIVGFSENEKQVISMLKKLHKEGITIALFAFTPVPGTLMAKKKPPDLAKYRRIQLAHNLITHNLRYSFRFNRNSELVSCGWSKKELLKGFVNTDLFQTTGCKGCNRPFYNEKPLSLLYNYHYKLTGNEFRQTVEQLGLIYDD